MADFLQIVFPGDPGGQCLPDSIRSADHVKSDVGTSIVVTTFLFDLHLVG